MQETAYAKINLALHVRRRREDGYHELETLFAFVDAGDELAAEPADADRLHVTGEFATGLSDPFGNIVVKALNSLPHGKGWAVTLEKRLPVAAGLGGGSADAAATLRALSRLWRLPLPDPATVLALGADVPVCLSGQTLRMQGVGEVLTPLPPLPETHILLVNPRVGVATPAVFRALARKTNPPLPEPPRFADATALAAWLTDQRE